MQTTLRSSGIALAATGLLFAPVASAHLHAATSFLPPTRSGEPSRVSGVQLVRDLQPAAEISRRTALLGGRLPWILAPVFDMFDVFQFGSFDPKTGDYRVYVAFDRAILPGKLDQPVGGIGGGIFWKVGTPLSITCHDGAEAT